MCSDYSGLIGPGVVVVATEFYKFWLKEVYTARPYWVQLGYRHLKLTSLCTQSINLSIVTGLQNCLSLSMFTGYMDQGAWANQFKSFED